MNRSQIERILKLHKLAYGLLMWLKEQARNDRSLLDAKTVETISIFAISEDWMRRHLSMVPAHLSLHRMIFWPAVSYGVLNRKPKMSGALTR